MTTRWDVYNNGNIIDSVYYDADMCEDDVKRSLINHDGYPHTISIYPPTITGGNRKEEFTMTTSTLPAEMVNDLRIRRRLRNEAHAMYQQVPLRYRTSGRGKAFGEYAAARIECTKAEKAFSAKWGHAIAWSTRNWEETP